MATRRLPCPCLMNSCDGSCPATIGAHDWYRPRTGAHATGLDGDFLCKLDRLRGDAYEGPLMAGKRLPPARCGWQLNSVLPSCSYETLM